MNNTDVPGDRRHHSGAEGSTVRAAQPRPALLHGCMLLSGFGTVFLGPVLPALTANAHTTDSGSGLFFTAQFIGAFFGGVTTSSRLWLSLLRGTAFAAVGFFGLGICVRQSATILLDAAALLVLGFGVGQMLTSTNLLASHRFAKTRSATLAKINFTWSLGALLGPFFLGALLAYSGLGTILIGASLLFALACAAALWNSGGSNSESENRTVATRSEGLPSAAFAYFAGLLLLYGGVETSLSGWLTTFGTRYGSGNLRISSLAVTALWTGITAGRALTPWLLRSIPERRLLHIALGTAALLVALLTSTSGAWIILALSLLLGFALAPWFPLVLASLLGEGATATQTGTVIAVSGIGAALLPLLVGGVSHIAHSLRVALLVPLSGMLLLLLFSFRQGPDSHRLKSV